MTDTPKREELARLVAGLHLRSALDPPAEPSAAAYAVVDDILLALMEPGEGAALMGARSIGETMNFPNHVERSKACLRAILTHIREGK